MIVVRNRRGALAYRFPVAHAPVVSDDGGGGGVDTPEWLPDGALIYADLLNGHYWAGGAEVAAGDIFGEDPDEWDNFDPNTEITEAGLTGEPTLQHTAMDPLIQSFSAVIEFEFTEDTAISLGLEIYTPPEWDMDFAFIFNTPVGTWRPGAYGDDYFQGGGITPILPDIPTGENVIAGMSFAEGKAVVVFNGGDIASLVPADTPRTIQPTQISMWFGTNFGSGPEGAVLTKLTVYALKTDEELQALTFNGKARSDLTLQWNVPGAVGQDLELQWDMQGLQAVGQDLELQWDVPFTPPNWVPDGPDVPVIYANFKDGLYWTGQGGPLALTDLFYQADWADTFSGLATWGLGLEKNSPVVEPTYMDTLILSNGFSAVFTIHAQAEDATGIFDHIVVDRPAGANTEGMLCDPSGVYMQDKNQDTTEPDITAPTGRYTVGYTWVAGTRMSAVANGGDVSSLVPAARTFPATHFMVGNATPSNNVWIESMVLYHTLSDEELQAAAVLTSPPVWLPDGAMIHADFVNDHYWAGGVETTLADILKDTDWWNSPDFDPARDVTVDGLVATEGGGGAIGPAVNPLYMAEGLGLTRFAIVCEIVVDPNNFSYFQVHRLRYDIGVTFDWFATAQASVTVYDNGLGDPQLGLITPNVLTKVAVQFDVNRIAACFTGSAVTTKFDTIPFPGPNQLAFFLSGNSVQLKSFTIYPAINSDAELQALAE